MLSLNGIARSVWFFCFSILPCAHAMKTTGDSRPLFIHGVAQAASLRHCGQSEDRYAVYTNPDLPFFAVFDGHKGIKAANFAKEKLHEYLYDSCIRNKEAPDYGDVNIAGAFERVGQGILSLKGDDSGTTAVTVFFSSDNEGLSLHVAHIGDSSAVLVDADGFQMLTKRHRPSNKSEIERIQKGNGQKRKSENMINECGTLRPTKTHCNEIRKRLFTDDENTIIFPGQAPLARLLNLKENKENTSLNSECNKTKEFDWETSTGLGVTRCFGHRHLIKDGLIYTPEISHISLKRRSGFVILYSDGVGDNVPVERAVNLIALQLNQGITLHTIARNLMIEAAKLEQGTRSYNDADEDDLLQTIRDDMTVLIVQYNKQQ